MAVHWDEHNSPAVVPAARSTNAAARTLPADAEMARTIHRFSGLPFYDGLIPFSPAYDEAAGGQYFVSPETRIRGPFADVSPGLPAAHPPVQPLSQG